MPDESPAPQPSISQPIGKHSRNWKKILLILVIFGLITFMFLTLGNFMTKQESPITNEDITRTLKNKMAFVKTSEISGTEIRNPYSYTTIISVVDSDIYLMSLDGTEEKIIDFDPDHESYIYWLSWSKSGEYLGWIRKNSFEYTSSKELSKKSVYSIKPLQLSGGIAGFAFAPDQKRVALLEVNHDPNSMIVRIFDLKDNKSVTEFKTIGGSPDKNISPSNRHIAWIGPTTIATVFEQGVGKNKFSISTFNYSNWDLEKRDIATLDDFPEFFVANTNINKISYWKINGADKELWTTDFNGSNSKKLTSLGVGTKNILNFEFSPDGRYLAYAWGSGNDGVDFNIFDTESNKLVSNKLIGNQFGWSPDSKKLAILAPFYSPDLVLIGVDGKKIKTVKEKPNIYFPAWFPQ